MARTPLKSGSTPKTKGDRSRKRELVRRGTKNRPGAGNLLVIRSGEDLRGNLEGRLAAMKDDFERMEFHAKKTISDFTYNETKEYPDNLALEMTWKLRENIRDFMEYKAKMKRLKILIDHFQKDKNYQLTVDEVVEIFS